MAPITYELGPLKTQVTDVSKLLKAVKDFYQDETHLEASTRNILESCKLMQTRDISAIRQTLVKGLKDEQ